MHFPAFCVPQKDEARLGASVVETRVTMTRTEADVNDKQCGAATSGV
jgi:hypothetical protein